MVYVPLIHRLLINEKQPSYKLESLAINTTFCFSFWFTCFLFFTFVAKLNLLITKVSKMKTVQIGGPNNDKITLRVEWCMLNAAEILSSFVFLLFRILLMFLVVALFALVM